MKIVRTYNEFIPVSLSSKKMDETAGALLLLQEGRVDIIHNHETLDAFNRGEGAEHAVLMYDVRDNSVENETVKIMLAPLVPSDHYRQWKTRSWYVVLFDQTSPVGFASLSEWGPGVKFDREIFSDASLLLLSWLLKCCVAWMVEDGRYSSLYLDRGTTTVRSDGVSYGVEDAWMTGQGFTFYDDEDVWKRDIENGPGFSLAVSGPDDEPTTSIQLYNFITGGNRDEHKQLILAIRPFMDENASPWTDIRVRSKLLYVLLSDSIGLLAIMIGRKSGERVATLELDRLVLFADRFEARDDDGRMSTLVRSMFKSVVNFARTRDSGFAQIRAEGCVIVVEFERPWHASPEFFSSLGFVRSSSGGWLMKLEEGERTDEVAEQAESLPAPGKTWTELRDFLTRPDRDGHRQFILGLNPFYRENGRAWTDIHVPSRILYVLLTDSHGLLAIMVARKSLEQNATGHGRQRAATFAIDSTVLVARRFDVERADDHIRNMMNHAVGFGLLPQFDFVQIEVEECKTRGRGSVEWTASNDLFTSLGFEHHPERAPSSWIIDVSQRRASTGRTVQVYDDRDKGLAERQLDPSAQAFLDSIRDFVLGGAIPYNISSRTVYIVQKEGTTVDTVLCAQNYGTVILCLQPQLYTSFTTDEDITDTARRLIRRTIQWAIGTQIFQQLVVHSLRTSAGWVAPSAFFVGVGFEEGQSVWKMELETDEPRTKRVRTAGRVIRPPLEVIEGVRHRALGEDPHIPYEGEIGVVTTDKNVLRMISDYAQPEYTVTVHDFRNDPTTRTFTTFTRTMATMFHLHRQAWDTEAIYFILWGQESALAFTAMNLQRIRPDAFELMDGDLLVVAPRFDMDQDRPLLTSLYSRAEAWARQDPAIQKLVVNIHKSVYQDHTIRPLHGDFFQVMGFHKDRSGRRARQFLIVPLGDEDEEEEKKDDEPVAKRLRARGRRAFTSGRIPVHPQVTFDDDRMVNESTRMRVMSDHQVQFNGDSHDRLYRSVMNRTMPGTHPNVLRGLLEAPYSVAIYTGDDPRLPDVLRACSVFSRQFNMVPNQLEGIVLACLWESLPTTDTVKHLRSVFIVREFEDVVVEGMYVDASFDMNTNSAVIGSMFGAIEQRIEQLLVPHGRRIMAVDYNQFWQSNRAWHDMPYSWWTSLGFEASERPFVRLRTNPPARPVALRHGDRVQLYDWATADVHDRIAVVQSVTASFPEIEQTTQEYIQEHVLLGIAVLYAGGTNRAVLAYYVIRSIGDPPDQYEIPTNCGYLAHELHRFDDGDDNDQRFNRERYVQRCQDATLACLNRLDVDALVFDSAADDGTAEAVLRNGWRPRGPSYVLEVQRHARTAARLRPPSDVDFDDPVVTRSSDVEAIEGLSAGHVRFDGPSGKNVLEARMHAFMSQTDRAASGYRDAVDSVLEYLPLPPRYSVKVYDSMWEIQTIINQLGPSLTRPIGPLRERRALVVLWEAAGRAHSSIRRAVGWMVIASGRDSADVTSIFLQVAQPLPLLIDMLAAAETFVEETTTFKRLTVRTQTMWRNAHGPPGVVLVPGWLLVEAGFKGHHAPFRKVRGTPALEPAVALSALEVVRYSHIDDQRLNHLVDDGHTDFWRDTHDMFPGARYQVWIVTADGEDAMALVGPYQNRSLAVSDPSQYEDPSRHNQTTTAITKFVINYPVLPDPSDRYVRALLDRWEESQPDSDEFVIDVPDAYDETFVNAGYVPVGGWWTLEIEASSSKRLRTS